MITAKDLHGVMAMMPSFTTPDGGDLRSTNTIAVDNLTAAVDRIIKDGIGLIATTGSFGECYNLLFDEFVTLTRATVEAAKKRVPVFIGVTSPHTRETIQKMKVVQEAGADGVLAGVPYYIPSTVENAIRFYHDLADAFPKLGILIYHNPPLHRVNLPVEAFKKITEKPQVVGIKDSHRTTMAFMHFQETVKDKMALFPNQWQYHPYALLGAAGCWSIDSWMGPWPVIALVNAVKAGDYEKAKQITMELRASNTGPVSESWREPGSKITMKYAGYCDPGPLRPPFTVVPPAVIENAQKKAAYWKTLCEKYRPQGQARATA